MTEPFWVDLKQQIKKWLEPDFQANIPGAAKTEDSTVIVKSVNLSFTSTND